MGAGSSLGEKQNSRGNQYTRIVGPTIRTNGEHEATARWGPGRSFQVSAHLITLAPLTDLPTIITDKANIRTLSVALKGRSLTRYTEIKIIFFHSVTVSSYYISKSIKTRKR